MRETIMYAATLRGIIKRPCKEVERDRADIEVTAKLAQLGGNAR